VLARSVRPILAIGALLAVGAAPLSAPTAATAAAAGINVQQVWTRTFPGVTFRESSPVAATLTTPAYVVGALDGKVRAFDAATGADEPGWPVSTTNPVNSSPAAADVLGDGHSVVFIGSGQAATTVAGACSGGGTYAIGYTGAVRWHNIGSDVDCANQAFHSSFAIGDTDGDGLPDATIGALGLQSPSYNAISGVMRPGWPFFTDDTVFSTPALADLQGTGVPDIVMGGDATAGPGSFRGGMMRAITGSGKLLWQFNVDEQVRSSPAVGTLAGTTSPSIVFGTGNFWLDNGGAKDSTSIFNLDEAGHLRWRKDLGGVTQAAPALADVAGSGAADIVEGTTGSPGNANGGLIWVLDGNGNPLPNWGGRNSDGGVVIGGISTADLNGDGAQDLLVPTGAGVFIYDGRTAQQLAGLDTGLVGFQNTPLVTDDGNGQIGITTAGTRPDGTGVVQHWRVSGGRQDGISWPMFHHDAAHTGNLAPAAAPAPAVGCEPAAAAPPPSGKVSRVAGADRDQTAIAASNLTFPTAASAHAVVLASDANFPDALAGVPLAATKQGPLLINPPTALSPAVEAEIQRVLPLASTVYVLGGAAALSPSIDLALETRGYLVSRLAGPDRFQTAVAIAGALGNPTTAFEVTGLNFPDALAAGPAASATRAAILLTAGASQSPATATYIQAHVRTRYAVGGQAATSDPAATPIAGADRYATAIDVAQRFFASPPSLGFATGMGFADALSGGPVEAARSGALILAPPCGALPSGLAAYVTSVNGAVRNALLFGGAGAVGDDVLSQLDSALG
jgi:hypothetical protein